MVVARTTTLYVGSSMRRRTEHKVTRIDWCTHKAQTSAKTAFNWFNLRSASLRIFGLLSNPPLYQCQYCNVKIPSKKFLDPDPDTDYHQNLIEWSSDYVQPFRKISWRFDQYFLSNVVNRQTDRQTVTSENSVSLAEVIGNQQKQESPRTAFYCGEQKWSCSHNKL